jgi:tetratricopeptide (TPR) repeat protein
VLLAEHLLLAGRDEDAARWYLRGGRAAFGASAFREAVGLLERACELASDAALHVEVLLALVTALDRTGDVAEEEDRLAELREAAAPLGDPVTDVDVLLAEASWSFRRSDYEECAAGASRAVALADAHGDDRRRFAARLWRGRALTWQGRHDDARAALEDALAQARSAGDPVGTAECLRYLAIVANNTADLAVGERLLREALHVLDGSGAGSATDRASVLGQLGAVLFNAERLEEAAAVMEEALRIFTVAGYRYGEAVCAGNLATVAAARGELSRALLRAEEALAVVEDINDREGTATTLGLIGDLHRRTGRRTQARETLARCAAMAADLDFASVESDARSLLALVEVDDGDAVAAVSCAREAVDLARSAGSPLAECQALDVLGWALLAPPRDPDEAGRAFAAAASVAADLGLPALAAEVAAGRAAAALAGGDAGAASVLLADQPVTDLGRTTTAPARALLVAVEVCRAAGAEERSREVEARAREWLDEMAGRVGDAELLAGFRSVPGNAALERALALAGSSAEA